MKSKCKTILLNPPTAAVATEPLLNLAYIAAVLRNNGHEALILDATAPYKPLSQNEIEGTIREYKPDFIGVTLTIMYLPQTYAYLRNIRKMGIPLVIGGPHANALPEEAIEHSHADIIAIGEGEETILDIANYFNANQKLEQIKGICYKNEGKVCFTEKRELIKNIDTIPFPDFADFPIKNYTGSDDPESNPIFWSIFSSRGCPYNCTFCSSHNVFGRTVRMRSAKNVFDEMKLLHDKFGAKKITFQDDEILCSKKRFIELCNLIIDSHLDIKMTIRTRIDSIEKEVLELGRRAGLSRISFGIESWNDETLKKVNKKYTVAKIHEKFKIISDSAFPYISFNNIIGFPWENDKHFKMNIEEISKLPQNINFFTTVATPLPYPKTALYDEYHEEYGFTNWWLEPENKAGKPQEQSKKTSPAFLLFMTVFFPLYSRAIFKFWNYDEKICSDIDTFCWSLFKIFINRHYSKINSFIIYISCKLSYFLWKRNPALERLVFIFPNMLYLKGLQREIIFKEKY